MATPNQTIKTWTSLPQRHPKLVLANACWADGESSYAHARPGDSSGLYLKEIGGGWEVDE